MKFKEVDPLQNTAEYCVYSPLDRHTFSFCQNIFKEALMLRAEAVSRTARWENK